MKTGSKKGNTSHLRPKPEKLKAKIREINGKLLRLEKELSQLYDKRRAS